MEEEELIPKKNNSGSIVWQWFGYKGEDIEQTTVICKVCHKSVATKGGSTTNLFHHLRSHPLENEECLKLRTSEFQAGAILKKVPKQPTLTQLCLASSFSRTTAYDRNSQKQKEITSAVTYHIAKDMAPESVVEKSGFKKLINTLDPRHNLPSHKYFAETALPKLYIKVREELADQLTNVTHFSTTADIWSSRTCEPYLSLTVHYIDNGELKSKCLQVSFLPEDHTGKIITQGLKDALMSWNLNAAHQVCITTDNGANIIKAVSLNQWTCLQCFGRRLHLAIGECFPQLYVLSKQLKCVCVCVCVSV